MRYFTAYIQCPGSYLCDRTEDVAIRSCVLIEQVCDGYRDCPAGDDEVQCGKVQQLIDNLRISHNASGMKANIRVLVT